MTGSEHGIRKITAKSRHRVSGNYSGHPWIFRAKRAVQAHAAKRGWGAPVHCPDLLPRSTVEEH